ncbi:MAG: NUDIX domain-containing protein [Actinomycetota bacterium]|nr:NUDIX domain-containing protein [Actinomycetota bacterium]
MTLREFPFARADARARAWLSGETGEPPPVRAAATVMLVRDGASGVEVFMLRRVSSMEFAPQAWVFPGGGVDPRDDAPDLPWAGPGAAEWAQRLGCDEPMARSLVAAAVREVFEECGVLLAGPTTDTVVADLSDPQWERERAALLSREQSLAQLLLRRGLVLRSDLLGVRAHWVTPPFEPRRYDTWFFSALLPQGQVPDDATTEADLADWTVPAMLLEQLAAGAATMLPPTVVCVESVAEATSAAGFVARAGSTRAVEPELVEVDGTIVLRADLP